MTNHNDIVARQNDFAMPFPIVGMVAAMFACCGCEGRNSNTVANADVISRYGYYKNCHVLRSTNGEIRLITQDGKLVTIQGDAEVCWFTAKENADG